MKSSNAIDVRKRISFRLNNLVLDRTFMLKIDKRIPKKKVRRALSHLINHRFSAPPALKEGGSSASKRPPISIALVSYCTQGCEFNSTKLYIHFNKPRMLKLYLFYIGGLYLDLYPLDHFRHLFLHIRHKMHHI